MNILLFKGCLITENPEVRCSSDLCDLFHFLVPCLHLTPCQPLLEADVWLAVIWLTAGPSGSGGQQVAWGPQPSRAEFGACIPACPSTPVPSLMSRESEDRLVNVCCPQHPPPCSAPGTLVLGGVGIAKAHSGHTCPPPTSLQRETVGIGGGGGASAVTSRRLGANSSFLAGP